jgi:hypothetical protein
MENLCFPFSVYTQHSDSTNSLICVHLLTHSIELYVACYPEHTIGNVNLLLCAGYKELLDKKAPKYKHFIVRVTLMV